MNSIIKNTVAVVVGLVIGSIVNMGFITIGGSVIPPPNGADATTMEGLKASIYLFEPKHFVFPFLAHAIGTFIGAIITSLMATKNKLYFAITIGVFFLIGGIINSYLLPAPTWFIALDLLMAYIPMAWLGFKLVNLFKTVKS